MKKKLLVVMSVLALVSVVAVFGTIGITTAFAASNARDSDKAPWTEEQLAEFQAEMEDR
ncbi:MAG: hypothetical protein FWD58_09140 [Firmicutes bacterium]|nr:hypothetical protein [Bacillota bacterium]